MLKLCQNKELEDELVGDTTKYDGNREVDTINMNTNDGVLGSICITDSGNDVSTKYKDYKGMRKRC